MKLNLGCGNKIEDGYVGVDLYGDTAEIKADLREVEFDDGSISGAICYHVIEHLNRDDGVSLIERSYRWLSAGSTLAIETPDLKKSLQLMKRRVPHRWKRKVKRMIGAVGLMGDGISDEDTFRRYHWWIRENIDRLIAIGKKYRCVPLEFIPEDMHPDPGQHHEYVWDTSELIAAMWNAGFAVYKDVPITHGRRANRDMRLVGVKF